MERKEFLKTCGLVCLGTTAVGTFLQGCVTPNYFVHAIPENNRLTIPKKEFVQIKKDTTTYRSFVLVSVAGFAYPIILYRFNAYEYGALLLECTHKGCELQPNGEYLVCPCHGSEFSNRGKVLNPPAERDLKTYETSTDNENIYISL